jgi:6,7-dimethyl-8-ribityllumazine synthase
MSLAAPTHTTASARRFKVGIAAARYNGDLVAGLLDRATAALRAAGVRRENIEVLRVPGSNELPVAAQILADRGRYDVLIALGVIVRGGTIHYELISAAVAHALQAVALEHRLAVINGVVVAESAAQARARCLGRINRGAEFAGAALEMAALGRSP